MRDLLSPPQVTRALGLNMSQMNLHFGGYPGG